MRVRGVPHSGIVSAQNAGHVFIVQFDQRVNRFSR